jgi:1,6-anhydro-N-acetylmuramate kinase
MAWMLRVATFSAVANRARSRSGSLLQCPTRRTAAAGAGGVRKTAGRLATGDEWALLAPCGDYLLFGSATEHRILLNIGGIANLKYLPAGDDGQNQLC